MRQAPVVEKLEGDSLYTPFIVFGVVPQNELLTLRATSTCQDHSWRSPSPTAAHFREPPPQYFLRKVSFGLALFLRPPAPAMTSRIEPRGIRRLMKSPPAALNSQDSNAARWGCCEI